MSLCATTNFDANQAVTSPSIRALNSFAQSPPVVDPTRARRTLFEVTARATCGRATPGGLVLSQLQAQLPNPHGALFSDRDSRARCCSEAEHTYTLTYLRAQSTQRWFGSCCHRRSHSMHRSRVGSVRCGVELGLMGGRGVVCRLDPQPGVRSQYVRYPPGIHTVL